MKLHQKHCFQKVAFESAPFEKPFADLHDKLARNPHLWDLNTERQDTPGSPHGDTRSIYVLGPPEMTPRSVFNDMETVMYPAGRECIGYEVAVIVGLAQAFAISWSEDKREPKLGRVMIASLKPGGFITPHVDEGAYADHFDRFHFVLKSDGNTRFNVGPFYFNPHVMELWWFNHKLTHSVVNLGEAERIHLIIDMIAPYWRMQRNQGLAAHRGSYQARA